MSGDCGEEFAERVRFSRRRRAVLWYWGQVLFALSAYFSRSFRTGADMLKNYGKLTWRNIQNHKLYSVVNILGLAVGMACCIMILLWVQDELLFDRFHKNFDDLFTTMPELDDTRYYDNPLALAGVLKQQYPEIKRAARFCRRTWLTRFGGKADIETGALVDEDFLKMFSFPLVSGHPDSVLSGRDSIVITERTAAKYFGEQNAVGETMTVNNQTPLVVTGVLKDVPANSHLQFDFLCSMKLMGDRGETSWSYEARTYLLLQKNVSWRDFAERISGFLMDRDKRTNQKNRLHMWPISRIHLFSLNGTDPIFFVYVFGFIAAAILIIACINFINLSTARSNTRSKEIGLRKVLGAGKADLIRQFISESMLMSAMALVLAVGLVYLLLPAFNNLAAKQMRLDFTGNLSLLFGLVGIHLFTGLVSGSYPAFLLSSFRPVDTLKGEFRFGSGGYTLRRILVVGQFTATIVLIFGAIMMARQLDFIRNRDLGLNREHVVAVTMNNELRRNYRAFKNEIRRNTGIVNVTAARRMPTLITHKNPVYWEGRGPEHYVTMTDASIDYDYFETLGMEIIQGRSFSEEFPTDRENYLLNEEAARITELDSPLGKMFSVWDDEGKIIGVVRNFHSASLHDEIGPVVFTLSQRHGSHQFIFVKVNPGNLSGTIKYLEKKAGEFAPNQPFRYRFLDDVFNSQYIGDRRRGEIYKYFTFLAIFISCLGLFGMASFTAEQRTKEIGIRKILGASLPRIIGLVSKDFFKLLLISNLIAWPIAAYLMSGMLNDYAYRTNMPPWVFFVSGAAAILVAMATVFLKIVRTAAADPVRALRYE